MISTDNPASGPPAGPLNARPLPSLPRVNLLRFFVTASIITVTVVTAVVAWLIAAHTRGEAIAAAEAHAVSVARHLERQLAERFGDPSDGSLAFSGLDDPDRFAALHAIVNGELVGFDIKRVYIFDARGTRVYASRAQDIGKVVEDNPGYRLAASGRVSSELVDAHHHLDAGGEESVPLLETYVPLRDEAGRIVAVIETYQDATALLAHIRAATGRVAAIAAAAMLLTIAILFVIFRRGDRLVQERTAALVSLTETLERRVEERTGTLVSQRRLAWLGTLSAGIAHEINNPLASITAASEGLLRRLDSGKTPDEKFRRRLEIIRDEAFRATAITSDLLDFARTEYGSRGPVDVSRTLESVESLVRLRRRDQSYDLALDLSADDRRLQASGSKLLQVLFNVTDNALDAIPGEGGKVTWTTRNEVRDGRPWLILRCEDNGPGVPPDVLERVFQPFFTTKAPRAGTGLGLSISQAIVESHGGTIEIVSELDRGTTVTISLPKDGTPRGSERFMVSDD